MRALLAGLSVLLLAGCPGSHGADAGTPGRDAGPPGMDAGRDAGGTFCERMPTDTDGDGIIDFFEGDWDADGDGTPNSRDLDSDDDGIPDADEAGPGVAPSVCMGPRDCDFDGVGDFAEQDADGDGIIDPREAELGTDPCAFDTDGDGCADVIDELLGGCDPAPEPVHFPCDLGAQVTVSVDPDVTPVGDVRLEISPAPGYADFDPGLYEVNSALGVTPVGGFRMFAAPVRYRLAMIETRRDGRVLSLPVDTLLPHVPRDARRVLRGSGRLRLGDTQARLVAGRLDALAALACRVDPRRARVEVRVEMQDVRGAPLPPRVVERACP